MKPWRTILIGTGRMGRNHLRVIRESAQFELVAIVEPGNLAPELLPPGVPQRKSLEECLAQDSFDVAIIASPTQTHFQVAQTLITRGKHLLVEKPLAVTYVEAKQLLELSSQHKTVLKVGHLERLNPAVRKLKETIDAGWIGRPIHFSFTRVGGYPASVAATNNVLMDLAVHDLDVLRFLVGSRHEFDINGVSAHSTWQKGILDTAEVLLESTDQNVSASIHVNWVTPTKIRTLRVTGTRGVCMVDYILQTCTLHGGDLIHRKEEPGASFEELLKLYQSTDKIEFGVDREEPLKVQLREFDRALKGEASLICDASEAIGAVDLAERSLSANHIARRARPEAPAAASVDVTSLRKPGVKGTARIHGTAIVEEGANVGDESQVWHFAHVRKGATVGRQCVLGKGVFVDAGVVLGDRVKVQNNVSIYKGVTIDSGVFVGPHVCFTNDLNPRAVGPDLRLKSADDWVESKTHVSQGASIGANSTIVAGITLGEWCMVAAGSVVTKDVPAYALVQGNPARVVGRVDEKGKVFRFPKAA